jgi:DNA-binding NtrC family response regulator
MPLIHNGKIDELKEDESLLKVIANKSYDLILLEDEIDMISQIKTIDPRAEVIIFGDREEEVLEAIKQGAYAYFSFPVDIERLKDAIESIADMFALRQENAKLEKQLCRNYTFFNGAVGKNPRMLEIFTFLKRIAPYYKTLTIMGESGTGKEVIAKALDSLSLGSKNLFTVCDCGALVETLVESELFGHKKGAFTGAVADKTGVFEAAGEGTIFLDEIGELPLPAQVSLLRVLQNGEFRRVGDQQILKARCRFIAATNKDLQTEVKKGNFREDLFYRITQFTINMPPLRERKDDIPLLVRYFLERFSNGTGKMVRGISRDAQIRLLSYDWPGNVRELENATEHAAILTTEAFIRANDLPEYIKVSTERSHDISLLDEVIKEHIEKVLIQCGGNKSKAAKILGMTRRSLLRRIEKSSILSPLEHASTKSAHLVN